MSFIDSLPRPQSSLHRRPPSGPYLHSTAQHNTAQHNVSHHPPYPRSHRPTDRTDEPAQDSTRHTTPDTPPALAILQPVTCRCGAVETRSAANDSASTAVHARAERAVRTGRCNGRRVWACVRAYVRACVRGARCRARCACRRDCGCARWVRWTASCGVGSGVAG